MLLFNNMSALLFKPSSLLFKPKAALLLMPKTTLFLKLICRAFGYRKSFI